MRCPNEQCRGGWIPVPTVINGVPIVGQMKCDDPIHAAKVEEPAKPKKVVKTENYSDKAWWNR